MELEESGVNYYLAEYSDLLFNTAITIYVLVTVLFIAALAGKTVPKAESAENELVGAGAGAGAGAGKAAADSRISGGEAGPADRTPGRLGSTERRRPLGERLANMAYAVVFVGIAAHIISIVLRTIATARTPLGNMYEFISMFMLASVVGGVIALRKPNHRPMLAFVLLPAVLLMLVGGKWLYANAAPLVPSLQSYWITIHVTIISIASGVLMVSGVASLLYLVKMRWPTTETASASPQQSSLKAAAKRIVDRIPSARALDRVAYKCVIFGFPLFGLGVICGAIWAEAAWGRFWGWDPKETVSFISWVMYAAYLHARATAGWRSQAAAWINVAALVSVIFNLFFINLVISGLHSYAGL